MQIYEATTKYNLQPADKAALDGLLYGIYENRISQEERYGEVKTMLTNACCCRAVNMEDMEDRIGVIMKYAEEFLRKNRRAYVSGNASVGYRGKQKVEVHKNLFE